MHTVRYTKMVFPLKSFHHGNTLQYGMAHFVLKLFYVDRPVNAHVIVYQVRSSIHRKLVEHVENSKTRIGLAVVHFNHRTIQPMATGVKYPLLVGFSIGRIIGKIALNVKV